VFADEVDVTLISAGPDFVERPRLHQLATGQAVAKHPLADLFAATPVHLRIDTVTGIDLERRVVALEGAAEGLGYDTLIYALGSNIDTGAVPGAAAHAASLTGIHAARVLGSNLRQIADESGRVVVCGGGLTGIETAAELAESFPALNVELVSRAAPGGWLSAKGRRYLARVFDELGIRVRAGVTVKEVASGELITDGGRVGFDTCVWAGGFSVPTLARRSGLAVGDGGRALVDPTLRSFSHPDVYVIGDAAAVAGRWGAQLAMGCRSGGFTGPQVADVVAARLAGREPKPFRYRYFHECISLGRKHGLVQFLAADETPHDRILTGRRAIAYKNMTLRGAQLLFRWPGPYAARRRHVSTPPAPALLPSAEVSPR
jgi:NADH dehydrogenase FAD-containing subunit